MEEQKLPKNDNLLLPPIPGFESETRTILPLWAQLILAFVISVILTKWTWGLYFLVLYIVVYEIVYFFCFWDHPYMWQLEERAGIIFASIFGYLVGTYLWGHDPVKTGTDRWVRNN